MGTIDPLELFLWTFRRNEKDVVNLYDSLSDVMLLATGGYMLNFGLWNEKTSTPVLAQENLCLDFGEFSKLDSNQSILDVGSGFCIPSELWKNKFSVSNVISVNINYNQLQESKKFLKYDSNLINSTATALPFVDDSFDRVLAFESAQHFKPLENFISESYRLLKNNGILSLAIPVMTQKTTLPIMKLGLLSMTWSSEHYDSDFIINSLDQQGFDVIESKVIGSQVYEPLADYYENNRESIKRRILEKYPSYVEKILNKSIKKMRQVSQKKIIDYMLISCQKH